MSHRDEFNKLEQYDTTSPEDVAKYAASIGVDPKSLLSIDRTLVDESSFPLREELIGADRTADDAAPEQPAWVKNVPTNDWTLRKEQEPGIQWRLDRIAEERTALDKEEASLRARLAAFGDA